MSTDAIYVRTSTKDQHGQAQVHSLSMMLKARGIRPDKVKAFVDIGHSGATTQRPELDAMMSAVHAGAVQRVFIFKLDRLGRSLTHLVSLVDIFKASGCTLVSQQDGFDLGTPGGMLQMQMMAALAEFERAGIRERIQSGVDRAKEKIQLGRPHAVAPHQVKLAHRMLKRGHSWREVAKALGVSLGSLHRACNRSDDVVYIRPGHWRQELLGSVS